MFNLTEIINSTLGSQEFLFATELFSFSFKLYLLIVLTIHGIRTSMSKKLLFLLIGVLSGSMLHSDASWIPLHFKNIYWPHLDFRIVGFMGRIGWAFFLVQNQALILLFENLVEKKFYLTKKHKVLLLISGFMFCCELYLAFFHFNSPSSTGKTLDFEIKLIQAACLHLIVLLIPTLYNTIKKIRSTNLPKILTHQLQTFITFLILPHLFLDLITNKLLFFSVPAFIIPLNKYATLSISNILISYALYFCCKRMMGLRFLNFTSHVEAKEKFNFINDFKDILEQLSYVTAMKELAHLTQIFFKAAFAIPVGRTRLYVRKTNNEIPDNNTYHDIIATSNKVENFLMTHDNPASPIWSHLKQFKIFIKDEIEFTNFYDEQKQRTEILTFLDSINADIFLPIYERQSISAYLILERNSRPDQLFNSTERDEMLVFTSYLSNIINILKHSNLEALLRKEKDLQEELYHKHQEINQYKEGIRSFLRTNKDRKIGILFYKGRRFTLANQAAQELIGIDINTNQGHPISQSLKLIAKRVQEFKSSQTIFAKDLNANRLVLSGIPSLENNSVIIMVYYPEISDIIKSQFETLKDPSKWDYLLYLETTQSGQLINQLVPGTGENLLNFKINLLETALSKKATLLEMAEDDLIHTIELLHHISLRQTLHTLKLNSHEKNFEVAIKLFGINALMNSVDSNEPLLQKLDNIGTLFIQNVHFLSLETQNYLAEFITYGFYHKFKSDHKFFSNVRIICSTTKNLQNLVTEGQFSKNLFNELKKTSLSMPSLANLPDTEITELADGFTEQALKSPVFKNLLDLSDKDKNKILDQKPVSFQELKTKVHQLLVSKSNKHQIHDQTEFDPAYLITDPELTHAVRLGKKALKDHHVMVLLWDKFKNQNKIASLLGVNRSSVNRRCQQYNLTEKNK